MTEVFIEVPAYVLVSVVAILVLALGALLYYTKQLLTAYMEASKWREAVIDALVVNWHYRDVHETDPSKAVSDLITAEIEMALDPLISREALSLIERGRKQAQEGIEEHWVDPAQLDLFDDPVDWL